jgi:hypothetical protein
MSCLQAVLVFESDKRPNVMAQDMVIVVCCRPPKFGGNTRLKTADRKRQYQAVYEMQSQHRFFISLAIRKWDSNALTVDCNHKLDGVEISRRIAIPCLADACDVSDEHDRYRCSFRLHVRQ